jgi:hypothetical protein
MNLYLDEDSAARMLASLLRKAGHRVTLPADVAMTGKPDGRQLVYALQQGLVLLTRNHNDFLVLHDLVVACGGSHPGILAVRSDKRDLKLAAIPGAIARLESSGAPLVNQFHVLNQWR